MVHKEAGWILSQIAGVLRLLCALRCDRHGWDPASSSSAVAWGRVPAVGLRQKHRASQELGTLLGQPIINSSPRNCTVDTVEGSVCTLLLASVQCLQPLWRCR